MENIQRQVTQHMQIQNDSQTFFRETPKIKKCYDDKHPISNQPSRFFATAKTHEFNTLEEINFEDLKLCLIIDQRGTYIYNVSKVIAKYLKPLAKDEFTISNILTFPDLIKTLTNSDEYEDVSYDVEFLFTIIPVKETINYIIN